MFYVQNVKRNVQIAINPANKPQLMIRGEFSTVKQFFHKISAKGFWSFKPFTQSKIRYFIDSIP